MTAFRHSVAFKLFAVTFLVIMLLLGGMLTVLAGSFASFYERRQIHDIAEDMNRMRDRYIKESMSTKSGGVPPYFFEFEKDYYALTSILTVGNNRFHYVIGGGFNIVITEPRDLTSLPGRLKFPISKPASIEQLDKLILATTEWQNDREAVEQVMLDGETLVFRAKGVGPEETGANQLVAIARIEGDGTGSGKVLIAVSSLQPISNAESVIRDFSYYVFGAAFVVVLILALLYARIVTKPLRHLNEAARRLASLDFAVRRAPARKDEIGELGRSLDFLADNLQHTLGELHEANEKLKDDIEREKRRERMRREFVAGVSHELKTPLSLIGGYAEGLKDNIGQGAKRERYAEVILEETKRMSAILADMLELSHLESGSYELKWEVFDIVGLLQEAVERAQALGEAKGIRASIRLPEDAGGNLFVSGDRMRIGQVLTNLLNNAVRHAPAGGEIQAAVLVTGQEAEIFVYNEGEPIAEGELPRIWHHFYRTDKSRSREKGGTGIGLAIVRQILQLHGSSYGVRNEADGVTFAFSLQRSEPDQGGRA